MTLKEKVLYHQIHPLKLTADIGCEPVSLYFFWRHDLALGLATHFVPPIAASLILIRWTDLETIKQSRAGAYLRHAMTRTVEAIRRDRFFQNFPGDIAAWQRGPVGSALRRQGQQTEPLAYCFRTNNFIGASRRSAGTEIPATPTH